MNNGTTVTGVVGKLTAMKNDGDSELEAPSGPGNVGSCVWQDLTVMKALTAAEHADNTLTCCLTRRPLKIRWLSSARKRAKLVEATATTIRMPMIYKPNVGISLVVPDVVWSSNKLPEQNKIWPAGEKINARMESQTVCLGRKRGEKSVSLWHK